MKNLKMGFVRMLLIAFGVVVLVSNPLVVSAADESEAAWMAEFGKIPIQADGRTMPLDTYARHLAVEFTGRTKWSAKRGPQGYAGRKPVQLLCDLLFKNDLLVDEELIAIENRPLKTKLGLDPQIKFFAVMELAMNKTLNAEITKLQAKFQADEDYRPLGDEQLMIDIQNAIGTFSQFVEGQHLKMVPNGVEATFLDLSTDDHSMAPENVQQAFDAFGEAYKTGNGLDAAVANFKSALAASGTVHPDIAKRVSMEMMYNEQQPWLKTAILYGIAIVFYGLSFIFLRKMMTILAAFILASGMVYQCVGLYLRVVILGRPPVSNTYEAILWMGLVAIVLSMIAQAINRKGWYVMAGLVTAELCVLFSMLVPLEDQMNALPPVLRSNYWLIVHVLTITASYGVLALSAILAHVYLFRSVIFAKKSEGLTRWGNPITTQVYRTMQLGVFLLTAGTILGGVWAADSWGRFWGWDPKETWALISIVIYVALLHARFAGWLQDFGLAVASIVGFMAIVWTFYGVNYVMASGLHSYGFGAGGEMYVGMWGGAEILLLVAAKIRHTQLLAASREAKQAARAEKKTGANDASGSGMAVTTS